MSTFRHRWGCALRLGKIRGLNTYKPSDDRSRMGPWYDERTGAVSRFELRARGIAHKTGTERTYTPCCPSLETSNDPPYLD